MTWESRGTLSLTNNSITVTGSGTFFNAIAVGSGIIINGVTYGVASVISQNLLTLTKPYAGTTASGLTFEAFPTESRATEVYNELVDLTTTFAPLRGSVDDFNNLIAATSSASNDSAIASANSATTATTQAGIATTQAGIATTKANEASTSANTATTQAGIATTQANTASTQAGIATTKANEAATSATNSANSADAALASQNAANTSAGNAAGSATTATTQAGIATTQATTATTQAGIATTQATNSANSADAALASQNAAAGSATTATNQATTATTQAANATTQATNAAIAAAAAQAALSSTLSAFDSFDDRYLGAKASNPTTDNDGDALVAGTIYYNSTSSEMRVYTGSIWVAAYVSGSGVLQLAGGTLTGPLTLSGNPTNALHAATKAYVDGASITGNAATATQLATTRTLSLTGDATGSMSFNGSANSSAALTLANSGVTAGTYRSVTVDTKGRVTAGTNPTTLAGYGITDALPLVGGTLTGSVTITQANSPDLSINETSATDRRTSISFRSSGATQYQIGTDASYNNTRDFYIYDAVANAHRMIIDPNGTVSIPSLLTVGSATSNGPVTVNNGSVSITHPNQLLLKNSTASQPTAIHRNDGTMYYILLSNASTNPSGTWNDLRPLSINTTTGVLSSANGQAFSGGLSSNGNISVTGNITASGSLNGTISSTQVTNALGFTPVRMDATVQGGGIKISNSTPSVDVFNGGLEIREVGAVGSSQTGRNYAPGLTFHWSAVAAAQLYMNSSGEFVFGAQSDKDNTRNIRASTIYSNGSVVVTAASGTAPAATLAAKSSTLAQNGGNGAPMTFNWSGQGGQPNWLWGGNDGQNHYVYNPSNFSVAEARVLRPSTTTGGGVTDVISATMADNDFFRLRVGGNGSNDGYVELATADDGNEPIHFRQYTGGFASITRTASILDSNGNTVFPQTVYAGGFHTGGSGTIGGPAYTSNWWRNYGTGGWYNETYGRGLTVPDGPVSYGNVMCYGNGLNGWQGISLSSNNKTNWMTDGNSWGMYNTAQTGWMMNADMAGNVTFAGNVTAYSDLRLKDNVREIDRVEERRDTLANSAIMYERDGRTRIGYGAQLLNDNGCSEFVREADDARKLATGTGTLSVDYGETAAILAVASKKTDDRVKELETQVQMLTEVIQALYNQLNPEGE